MQILSIIQLENFAELMRHLMEGCFLLLSVESLTPDCRLSAVLLLFTPLGIGRPAM